MPSRYEMWLLDDAGQRITMLDNLAYFSYSRSLLGYGTLLIGIPYDQFVAKVKPVFAPDRFLDIWRSPGDGYLMRREAVYILRLDKIYTRETDNLRIIAFTGRDVTDLLSRRYVVQAAGSSYTRKTAAIDDLMKAIVREQMLWGSAVDENGVQDNDRAYPQGGFTVEGDMGLGPNYSAAFADRNVLDILKELKQASFQLFESDPILNNRIFFDVVPFDILPSITYILDEVTSDPIMDEAGFEILDESSSVFEPTVGFQFRTFANLRGDDRTAELEFSVENNNLQAPYFTEDHLGEVNAVIVKGYGRGESRASVWVEDSERIHASRWNRIEGFKDGSQEPDASKLENIGYPELYNGRPKEELSAVFLNVEAGPDSPRSLYRLDWDLGDVVRVNYAEQQFNVEIVIVYVAVDENGKETITGRNQVSATLG